MAVGAPAPDRARDDVARRQFRARRTRHEPLAGLVDQRRALAAHGLADERHGPRSDVERSRMELHELHVGERGAGARREREALAEAAQRIGAVLVESADPAGRDDDAARPQTAPAPTDPIGEDAANRVVLDDEAARLEALENRRSRASPRAAAISARMISRPAPSPPACTMRGSGMRGFEPEREAAVGDAVEAHAETREPYDRGRRGARKPIDDRSVAQAVAGGERVGGVQGRAVVRADRGGEAALRPEGRALRAERPLRQER